MFLSPLVAGLHFLAASCRIALVRIIAVVRTISAAEVMTFCVYRVEAWPLSNKNAGNISGMLWYLHNEVVWHAGGRHGTYFSTPVTKLARYLVSVKPTQKLADMGMNFGVVNTMDSNKNTGPWACDNLQRYGDTVGCETREKGNPNNFPHQQ